MGLRAAQQPAAARLAPPFRLRVTGTFCEFSGSTEIMQQRAQAINDQGVAPPVDAKHCISFDPPIDMKQFGLCSTAIIRQNALVNLARRSGGQLPEIGEEITVTLIPAVKGVSRFATSISFTPGGTKTKRV